MKAPDVDLNSFTEEGEDEETLGIVEILSSNGNEPNSEETGELVNVGSNRLAKPIIED